MTRATDPCKVRTLLSKLQTATGHAPSPGSNGNWTAHCPAHQDRRASLSIKLKDGKLLLYCHAGCETENIARALGLTMADLSDDRDQGPARKQRRKPAKTAPPKPSRRPDYVYVDADGVELHGTLREPGKRFLQARTDAASPTGWFFGLGDIEPVLYDLPDVLAAVADGRTIYIVEGEKDVSNLRALGLTATTNPMGAGKWRREYSETLAGAHVAILPDNDEPGRRHAENVAGSLCGKAASIRVLELPGLPPKGDVSDWLDAGGTIERLEALAEAAAEYAPPKVAVGDRPVDLPDRLTELALAERFAALHADDVRWHCNLKQWLVYEGGRWAVDEKGQVQQFVKHMTLDLYRAVADVDDDKRRKEALRFIALHEREARRNAILALAQSEPGMPVTQPQMDADGWLLNCLNGTVDLRTGELRPHDPADLCMKQAPVVFGPSAEAPRWTAFLNEIMGENAALLSFLQMAVGSSMPEHTREQILLILHGSGSNGKTCFTETISRALGSYAESAEPETLMAQSTDRVRNDIAGLAGARFVLTSEPAEGRRLDEALVKKITGSDSVKARFLFREFFRFKPGFRVWLVTNHKPMIAEVTHAIWRRVRLVPFEVTIPDERQDQKLPEKLIEELPGIFNWALAGCLAWQAEGRLVVCDEVRDATAAYRAEEDFVGQFIQAMCVEGSDCMATSAALRDAYIKFCEDDREKPISAVAFGRKLRERGFIDDRARVNDKLARVWRGVGLSPLE